MQSEPLDEVTLEAFEREIGDEVCAREVMPGAWLANFFRARTLNHPTFHVYAAYGASAEEAVAKFVEGIRGLRIRFYDDPDKTFLVPARLVVGKSAAPDNRAVKP